MEDSAPWGAGGFRPGRLAAPDGPVLERISAGAFRETPGYRVIRDHGRNDYLLTLTTGGRGRFRTAAGQYCADPGTAVLLSPGDPQDYGVDPESASWSIVFGHFLPRPDWGPLLAWPEPLPGLRAVRLAGTVLHQVTATLMAMARWARSGHPHASLLALNALEVALVECDLSNPESRQLDPRIAAAMSRLDTRLAEDHPLPELAAEAHLSVSRFAHLFAAQVGTSPRSYVERQRMAQARMYLESTGQPIAAIARIVGYADPLYFSTRFRAAVGCSPRAYRARFRSDLPSSPESFPRQPIDPLTPS